MSASRSCRSARRLHEHGRRLRRSAHPSHRRPKLGLPIGGLLHFHEGEHLHPTARRMLAARSRPPTWTIALRPSRPSGARPRGDPPDRSSDAVGRTGPEPDLGERDPRIVHRRNDWDARGRTTFDHLVRRRRSSTGSPRARWDREPCRACARERQLRRPRVRRHRRRLGAARDHRGLGSSPGCHGHGRGRHRHGGRTAGHRPRVSCSSGRGISWSSSPRRSRMRSRPSGTMARGSSRCPSTLRVSTSGRRNASSSRPAVGPSYSSLSRTFRTRPARRCRTGDVNSCSRSPPRTARSYSRTTRTGRSASGARTFQISRRWRSTPGS